MAKFSHIAVLLSVFAFQAVTSKDYSLPYDFTRYRALLNKPPYFTHCDVAFTTFWDVSVYEKLNKIGDVYDVKMHYYAQWYALITSSCPMIDDSDLYDLLDGYSYELQQLMYANNISFLPPTTLCNPFESSTIEVDEIDYSYTSEEEILYQNYYMMMTKYASRLPFRSMLNLRNLTNQFLPDECLEYVDLLSTQINSNMRFSLATAMRDGRTLYPFF